MENFDSFNFNKWFGDSKVVDDNGNPKLVYHGSEEYFNEFNYSEIGKHGSGEGYGFYFTNSLQTAKGYTNQEGYLYSAYLKIEKPLSNQFKNITEKEFKQFLAYIDPEGTEVLINFGEVDFQGWEEVLNEATEIIYESSEDDIDLIHDIINATGGDIYKYYNLFYEFFGYDGVIEKYEDYDFDVYVAFFNEQIYIVDIEKIS